MSNMTMAKLKNGMCRWPSGDPVDDDFHFCGKSSDPDESYCDKHMVKARAPARKARGTKAS